MKKKSVAIIGCGRLGSHLGNILSENNENVLVMDKDSREFKKLSSSFGGITYCGDATEIDALIDAEIKNYSTVLVVTNDDNTNIMISQILRYTFNMTNIITRISDVGRVDICKDLNIKIICPTILAVENIKQKIL